MPCEELLRPREAARLLNISVATLTRLRDKKQLAFVWVGGSVRIEAAELQRFIARQRRGNHDVA